MNGLVKSRADAWGLGINFMTESMRGEYHRAVHGRLSPGNAREQEARWSLGAYAAPLLSVVRSEVAGAIILQQSRHRSRIWRNAAD